MDQHLISLMKDEANKGNRLLMLMFGHGRKSRHWMTHLNTDEQGKTRDAEIQKMINAKLTNGQMVKLKLSLSEDENKVILDEMTQLWTSVKKDDENTTRVTFRQAPDF